MNSCYYRISVFNALYGFISLFLSSYMLMCTGAQRDEYIYCTLHILFFKAVQCVTAILVVWSTFLSCNFSLLANFLFILMCSPIRSLIESGFSAAKRSDVRLYYGARNLKRMAYQVGQGFPRSYAQVYFLMQTVKLFTR